MHTYIFQLVLQLNELLFAHLLRLVGGDVLALKFVEDVRLDVFDVQSLVVAGRLDVVHELHEGARRTPKHCIAAIAFIINSS